MSYDITGYKGDIIVISNTGDKYSTTGVISITNIKSTYTSDPTGIVTASEETVDTANETTLYMTPAAATLTLRSINAASVENDTVVEDSTGSEDTTQDEIVTPDTGETEDESTGTTDSDTEIKDDESSDTETDTVIPEESEKPSGSNNPFQNVMNTIKDAIKNIFNKVSSWMSSWKGGRR